MWAKETGNERKDERKYMFYKIAKAYRIPHTDTRNRKYAHFNLLLTKCSTSTSDRD